MKREGIGTLEPTQTAPANFETSEHYCDILTTSMINIEDLDVRAHKTQVREGCEAGREMRVYMEKGKLMTPEATVGNKAKRKLEQICLGSGWLTVLTIS